MNKKFSIELFNLHWIEGIKPEEDPCAHAQVKVHIGDEVIVDQNNETTGWAVSSTVLLLLRTLERDHTKENPVGDVLIPCCGFNFVFDEGMKEVYIPNCPSGYDWEVKHNGNFVKLTTASGTEVDIPFDEYKQQVLNIADQVEEFYKNSAPKTSIDPGTERGYKKFREEWRILRSRWH